MATTFEIIAGGNDEPLLRAASERALAEIDRLEEQLSRFLPASELSRINTRAVREPVRVEPRLFDLLRLCRDLWRLTGGGFDMALGGMRDVRLRNGTIRFARPGVALDLGGIGKGYALDRAAAILREHGVSRALLHGGWSTILAIGSWPIGVVDPRDPSRRLGRVVLTDAALSSSVARNGIVDPRTGRPVEGVAGAWAIAATGAESDAWSTALVVLKDVPPGVRGMVLLDEGEPVARGIDLAPAPPRCDFTRRKFIAAAAAGVAAFSVGMPAAAQPVRRPPEVRLAVIGTGEQGQLLLSTLAGMEDVRVQAVCDVYSPHLDRALEIAGRNTESYDDWRQLLDEEEVDAVVIATPLHLHSEMAVAALGAGMHVFCESVLGRTADEAKAVVRAAREAGRVVHVGHHRRSSALYRHALTHIRAGAIGRIVQVRAQWNRKLSWRHAAEPEHERLLNWRLYRETSGGLLAEQGSHVVDLVNWYLDAVPRSVTGIGTRAHWNDGREVDDQVEAIFEYPEGVIVSFGAALTNSFQDEYELIRGTQASILLAKREKGLLFKEADCVGYGWEAFARHENLGPDRGLLLDAEATKYATHERGEEIGTDVNRVDLHAEMEAFLAAVRGEAPAPCDAVAGMRAAVATAVANEAIERRTRIDFTDQHFGV